MIMDNHSEIEIKFAADSVSLKAYHSFVASYASELLDSPDAAIIDGFKRVEGVDTFFSIRGKVLRYRDDLDGHSEFTYKSRKSKKSITDRVEINVPLKDDVSSETVKALVKSLGGKVEFRITKVSYIYHIRAWIKDKKYRSLYNATLALYTVYARDLEPRNFLEVEIESSSDCSQEMAIKALDLWTKRIRKKLKLKKPLNASLYEIYSEKMR